MPKGTIARIIPDRGGFGYITPDDGSPDVHFVLRDMPAGVAPAVGVRLEYDLQVPQPAKGPHALNLRVENGAAPAPAPAGASPPKPAIAPSEVLGVVIRVGATLTLGGQQFRSVMVDVTRDGAMVPDKPVELWKNDSKKGIKPSVVNTKLSGTATFSVPYEDAEAHMKLTAKVGGGTYTEVWDRDPAVAAAPPPVPAAANPAAAAPAVTSTPVPVEVQKTPPDSNGVYTFQVKATPNKPVSIGGNVAVEARIAGTSDWKTNESFDADNNGHVTIEVQVKNPRAKGEIFFVCEGIKSDPPRLVQAKE